MRCELHKSKKSKGRYTVLSMTDICIKSMAVCRKHRWKVYSQKDFELLTIYFICFMIKTRNLMLVLRGNVKYGNSILIRNLI